MNRSSVSQAGVAARRPWPFGPPLRGRAARSDAGLRSATRRDLYALPSTQARPVRRPFA